MTLRFLYLAFSAALRVFARRRDDLERDVELLAPRDGFQYLNSASGGGSVVLVEEAVEAIAALDGAAVCSGEWVWRAQPEHAMG